MVFPTIFTEKCFDDFFSHGKSKKTRKFCRKKIAKAEDFFDFFPSTGLVLGSAKWLGIRKKTLAGQRFDDFPVNDSHLKSAV